MPTEPAGPRDDAPVPPAGPEAAAPARPARLLVVDDETTVTELLQEFLVSLGHEVGLASNGEEAVRRIPEFQPDVVLTDLNMTGLSGLDVLHFARRTDPEIMVILITGETTTATAIDAMRQGAYDYITKPFELDDVQQSVDRSLANRRLRALNRSLVEELRQKNEILRDHERELMEKVRRATEKMTTLYEVGMQISANLELVPRLDIIAMRAAELPGAAAAVLFLRVQETEECRVAAVHGLELPAGDREHIHFFAAERAIGFTDFHHAPVRRVAGGGAPIELPAFPGRRFESLLAVPLKTEGHVIGLLVVLDKPGGFTVEDESFLALYASQAAIAVRNSQLYEHTKSLDRLKSEFVAVVSHEIRTPLTSVKGAVELLTDGRYFRNTEPQQKLLSIAHANAERLLVLINDILDFSKLESASLPMNIERQRLEPVVRQAIQNLRTLIGERRIDLEADLPADLPDLMLDSSRIAQVLTNLLSNAIKFSPPEGRIEVVAALHGDQVRVSVRDDGEGIDPADVPKLFRKFSQLDGGSTRTVGGTGLGLVICKGIVEQHGGTIGVDSTPGEGSTFWFTLPRAEARQEAAPAGGDEPAPEEVLGGDRPAA